MGRHAKIVLNETGLDRRETGYYSTPEFIADFIATTLMSLNPDGKEVFDPCIGAGELTYPFFKKGKMVKGFDIIDMNPAGVSSFQQQDFLRYFMEAKSLSLFNKGTLRPDYIVANPPYNCHETDYIRTHKKRVNQRIRKKRMLEHVFNVYEGFNRTCS